MDNVLKNMQEYLELRGLSDNTQSAYLRIVRKFSEFFNNSPEKLGAKEIKKYLLHLLRNQKQSSSTIGVTYAALKFFYTIVLRRPWVIIEIPHMKKEKKLPVILNREEINAIIDAPTNIKHKAILTLLYSSGLRASEVGRLKIEDIDSSRMQIRVQNTKGKKERYTILSKEALKTLRQYWKVYQPEILLFPGRWHDRPMTYKAIDFIFKRYKDQAGVKKQASAHSFRHSFATHLLGNDVDLYHIQLLLGHSSPHTTMVYLHVRRVDLEKIASPFDLINKKKS